ncbi:MAG: hypothetical protein MHM6MM_002608 [Cercozoa sp. M6MM]
MLRRLREHRRSRSAHELQSTAGELVSSMARSEQRRDLALPLSPKSPTGLSSISEEPAHALSSRAVASFLSTRIAELTQELQALSQQWQESQCDNENKSHTDMSEAHRLISQTYDELMRTTHRLRDSLLKEPGCSAPGQPVERRDRMRTRSLSQTPTPSTRQFLKQQNRRPQSSGPAPRRLKQRSASVSVFGTHKLSSDSGVQSQNFTPRLVDTGPVVDETKRLCERVMDEPRNVMRQIALLQHVCFNSSTVLHSAFLPFSAGTPDSGARTDTFSGQWLAVDKHRRSAESKQMLEALQRMEKCLEHGHEVLRRTRVLCIDPSELTSNDSKFIQFAFPGFETYIACIGNVAVVPVVGAFAEHGTSQSLWQSQKASGANRNIAKELMLTIPETIEGAKQNMTECLLSLVLAQYFYSRVSTLQHALCDAHANGQTWTFTYGDVINALQKSKSGKSRVANDELLWEHAFRRISVNPTIKDATSNEASECCILPPMRFLHVLRDLAIRKLEALGAVQGAAVTCRQKRRRRSSISFGNNESKRELLSKITEHARRERQQLNLTLQCLDAIELDKVTRYVQLHLRTVASEQAIPMVAALCTPSPMRLRRRLVIDLSEADCTKRSMKDPPPLFSLEGLDDRSSPESPVKKLAVPGTPRSELLGSTSPSLRLRVRSLRKCAVSDAEMSDSEKAKEDIDQ